MSSDRPPDNHGVNEITFDVAVASDFDPRDLLGLGPDDALAFRSPLPLALNPTTNNSTVPDAYLQGPLVRERYFFSLPPRLWDEVHQRIGESAFEQSAAQLEDAVGEICNENSGSAGLFRGIAFPYHQLHRVELPRLRPADVGLSITQAELDRQLRISDGRLTGVWTSAQGYLGWLLTCRTFLDEHDALIQEHAPAFAQWGTAAFGQPLPPFALSEAPESEQVAFRTTDAHVAAFLIRWRLLGLAAPYLPIPMQPQFAGSVPDTMLRRFSDVRALFVVPDTFPIPSRDEFRGMLDDTLHSSPPEHLAEWMRIVGAGNSGKRKITRFGRIFQLQHYWRVIQRRHAHSLRRRNKLLGKVLATFLDVEEKVVNRDLAEIRRRLGRNWLDRGVGSPIGPF